MSNSCSYNCSVHPSVPEPNTDITGIGVIIGYVGTAGIVVAIIVVYYLTSYNPDKDPFNTGHSPNGPNWQRPFLTNPFDSNVRSICKKIGQIAGVNPQGSSWTKYRPRLEEALIQCVLSMSDLQILTGLSIMISGFAQLHCGISCYHWQLLTYLAWFSSLTHMACLTFLRQYLYMHQSQRAWRLLAMGILVIMLFVALIPSGAYNWSTRGSSNDADPGPADYAICYLTQFGHSEPMTLGSMILSVLVVSLGYLSRVTRLHKILAIDGLAKARHKGSLHARALLKRVYTWSDAGTSTKRLAKLILYRPLLGVFLVFRVIIDAWSSMFVEIFWLLVAYYWGCMQLFSTWKLFPSGDNNWTFGQVIPTLLLASPLLAIFEYLYSEHTKQGVEVTDSRTSTCKICMSTHTRTQNTSASSSSSIANPTASGTLNSNPSDGTIAANGSMPAQTSTPVSASSQPQNSAQAPTV